MIDPSTQRFNTKEILFYFVNLLSPDKFKNLDPHKKAVLAEISNGLAQVAKELQNPLPRSVDNLKVFLGTPAKGSKPLEILTRLNTFENNYLPNLILQQEELKKAREMLRTQFTLLIAQGENLDPARMENLKAEIEKFRTNKVQSFSAQKEDVVEKLKAIQDEATKATGKPLTQNAPELEEGPTVAVAAAVAAAPNITPLPETPTPQNK